MHIYSKSMKHATSLSLILILFVLSDRAWCGLQIFYTELWNSLIMQIYAHLFKINEKCHLSSILKSQQICTWGGDIYYASRNLLSTCFNCKLTVWGNYQNNTALITFLMITHLSSCKLRNILFFLPSFFAFFWNKILSFSSSSSVLQWQTND